MKSCFDEAINREGTNSVKWDLRREIFGSDDLIPMWVADMDFRTPSFITNAIRKRAEHEVFGYTYRDESYFASIVSWLQRRQQWRVKPEWILFCPGVVPALNLATLAFTSPGDEIIVQPPVYPPFFSAVTANGRKLVSNQLMRRRSRYLIDFEALRSCITPRTKMLILSHPHNPVGRVWNMCELRQLTEICTRNNIIILSDEIHSDLVLPGSQHIPLASVSEEAAAITVTCIAPSKTFNIAGLSTSSVIISDEALRKKFTGMVESIHIGNGNIFGNEASVAAYTHGDEWLDELLEYIAGNIEFTINYLIDRVPLIRPVTPEATYMIWLDCTEMGMSGAELAHFFTYEARVGLNEGSTFGEGGEGFMRMNLACSRSLVEEALGRIEKAVKGRRAQGSGLRVKKR
jgi:cysteine-S-conjugate beta-lyase